MRASCKGVLVAGLLLVGACGQPPKPKVPEVDVSHLEGGTTVTYTVQPGDTWQHISELYFGTARAAVRLAAAHGGSPEVPPDPGSVVEVAIGPDELDLARRIVEARGPYNTGVDLMQRDGREDEAVAAFEQALDVAPQFVDARYNLGLVLLREGRPAEAEQQLKQVVAERAQDKDARYALASAYFHQGLYEKAQPELEAALGLDPNFLRARFTYALALERLGQVEPARQAWQQYLELDAQSAWAAEARSHLQQLP
jgi:tetratricopeptide (TPR) repeat protein